MPITAVPTSSAKAGGQIAPSGFTLIELLVVLGIMSLLAAIAMQSLPRQPVALDREKGLAQIRTVLSQAQQTAARTSRPAQVPLAAFSIDRLSLAPAIGEDAAILIVYPDGSSTGGTLRRDGRTVAVIDWLTGAVTRG